MPRQQERFDRLFHALESTAIYPLTRGGGRFPRSVKSPFLYPINKGYLGFSGVQRRRLSQVQDWLRKANVLPEPGTCSICRSMPGAYHSENYFDTWQMRVVCKECHRAVHTRDKYTRRWEELVARYAQTGEEWFAVTPIDQDADFAGYLKHRFGPNYDLLSASFASVSYLVPNFPADKLLSESFPVDVKPVANPAPETPPPAGFQQLDLGLYPGPIKPVARR